ncbi:Protein hunchback-like protein [Argiope bruennichi]|uniref:Protein hunchback-like protein n=1 Tax=Argiope bruennichi TaxID=94029 RepID=A0A8T0FX51_ARGBR|nr:Protein hunchback-like protein [Argiope bruennichi]
MAPLVEQEKNNGNDVLAAEHPDDHYTSTETNSSENNSDVHPDDEDSINKLRNLPLNDNSPNVNGSLSNDHRSLSQLPLDYVCSIKFPRRNARTINGMNKLADSSVNGNDKLVFDGFYRCHKCDFVGRNDDELHEHALRHDPYECGSCGFLADSQDSLQMHLRDDHSDIPVSLWDDHILFHETTVESSPKKTSKVKPFEENIDKPRKTPCKICNNFTGNSKMEYYAHLRDVHSETGKLLHCDLCPFIALYKHHLEYHFRNHYGSKPYKCDRCDYSCVNRSMLNSHYKSHSDVYQYSCKIAIYAQRNLPSLKCIKKFKTPQPGRVLNPDGSVNSNTIIDVHVREVNHEKLGVVSSSASPQFGNGESKAIAQKTNRRKGKAFKLNQYTIESDPVSDGIENELEKMSVLYESYYSNEAQGKPTFGADLKLKKRGTR